MPQGYDEKVGLTPGSLVHIGEHDLEHVKITAFSYKEHRFETFFHEKIADYLKKHDSEDLLWLNIDGISEAIVIEEIGKHFKLHSLILEDIMNANQRPKLEEYPGCLYIVIKMIYFSEQTTEVATEQISFVIGENFVLSFQEREQNLFTGLMTRIQNRKNLKKGHGYLLHALVDSIVDYYFVVLEKIGESLDDLEEEILQNPNEDVLKTLHSLRRELISLRRTVWPLREVLKRIQIEDLIFIEPDSRIYFRDVYDHTLRVYETAETYRETLSSMLEIYMTNINNRMNEVMKVLTFIATIFIPLSFIAGVYGMNFKHMPETQWEWGYPFVLLLMFCTAVSMFLFFRYKKWL